MLKKIISFACLFLFLFTLAVPAQASRTEKLKELKVFGDFDLGPTLFYIEAKPGENITRTLQLTNRSGQFDTYQVEVEDFQGSADNPTQTIVLLSQQDYKYGAKDWITPELKEFSLNHADRLFFDLSIKVPADTTPGDHYAAVLIHPKARATKPGENAPNVNIISRVGTLFVIRVAGEIKEEGQLQYFKTDKPKYTEPNVEFKYAFRNTGTVLLQPDGHITIKDMLGRTAETIDVKPFRVFRDSIRENIATWKKSFLIGRYTATLELNRGYGDLKDTQTVTFWVIPWKTLALAFGALILLILIIIFLRKKVSIQFKVKR